MARGKSVPDTADNGSQSAEVNAGVCIDHKTRMDTLALPGQVDGDDGRSQAESREQEVVSTWLYGALGGSWQMGWGVGAYILKGCTQGCAEKCLVIYSQGKPLRGSACQFP